MIFAHDQDLYRHKFRFQVFKYPLYLKVIRPPSVEYNYVEGIIILVMVQKLLTVAF